MNDQQAIDAIATLLGTSERWDADTLETLANIVGEVRPHPGNMVGEYVGAFRDATGRETPAAFIVTEDDDEQDSVAGVRP